jgi:hypothetical protein
MSDIDSSVNLIINFFQRGNNMTNEIENKQLKHSHLADMMMAKIVLGNDLKILLEAYGISIEEITANYTTGKGTVVSKTAVQRYKNVTVKDVEGGQCYPKGIPNRFMQWLFDYIVKKHNVTFE